MQGHVRKRGKGSWEVVVDLGRDAATGRRKQLFRSVKGKRRDADALLVQLLAQRDSGIDAPPGRITLADFLEKWLTSYAEPNTAPKTFRRYGELLHRHVVPAVGNVPLAKLRPLHLQGVYRTVTDGGLSARTALHVHRVLREALNHAVKWQLLSRNPADAVEPPRPSRFEVPVLELDHLRRLLAVADETRHGTLVNLALMTGLRQGELLGLRWEDVDLEAATLRVRQNLGWLSGQGFFFGQPKTRGSARPVALDRLTVNRLRQHRTRQLEERLVAGLSYEEHRLVFTDLRGRPIHPSTLRLAWLGIVKGAGPPHLRFHDLRHAHATLLLQQGVHPKIVSERLGHSAVGITLDIYSHVLPNLQAEAANRLADLLAK